MTLWSLFSFAIRLQVEVAKEYYESYVVQGAELHHPHWVVAGVTEPEQHVQVEEHVEGELSNLETDIKCKLSPIAYRVSHIDVHLGCQLK